MNSNSIELKELKELKLLFIENDSALSDLDRNTIHHYLKGSEWRDKSPLEAYDIEWIFDAQSKLEEVINKLKLHDNILLYTSFTGESYDMLEFFIQYCTENNIKNKRIFNLFSNDCLSTDIEYCKKDLQELDDTNNISLYCLNVNMFRKYINPGSFI